MLGPNASPALHAAYFGWKMCNRVNARFAFGVMVLAMFSLFAIGCGGDAYGCPPALQLNSGCQVQQFRQQVYAAPIIQQQVVSPFYQQQVVQQVVHPQKIIVQQVRQHHAQAIVQQVQVQKVVQPRVQVQRSRTVIRSR
jgi:hypothetical protein